MPAAEQAVRCARVHLLGALGHKGFGRRDQRPARVNHVVVQDADLAGNVADKRGDFSLIVLRGDLCAGSRYRNRAGPETS